MKQMIILIATIMLGLAIGGIIMGFEDTAEAMGQGGKKQIESVLSNMGVEI